MRKIILTTNNFKIGWDLWFLRDRDKNDFEKWQRTRELLFYKIGYDLPLQHTNTILIFK